MTTALIADDEPHLAAHLQQLLARAWPELQIAGLARNGPDASAQIEALRPDVAFLDIKMPGATGLEVAQGIEGRTGVVFVTAYDEYAVTAFDHAALDYLLKPVTAERLAKTVARVRQALAAPGDDDARLANALQRLLGSAALVAGSVGGTGGAGGAGSSGAARDTTRLRYIRAGHGDTSHQVAVDDVLFFRADDKYTCVRTAAAEHLIRTPISELTAQLDPADFVQIHRSTVVNLTHVAGTRRDELSRLYVRLRGHAAELPVSRAYVHLFKAM